jgi:tRNA pseudouridine38-40 synthase
MALIVRRTVGELSQRVELEVEADGFLYNMVRNIVGTLVEVGRGNQSPDWVRQVLQGGRREQGGATAPAHGLCLISVGY